MSCFLQRVISERSSTKLTKTGMLALVRETEDYKHYSVLKEKHESYAVWYG